jgi:atypical protein kinase C zeta type
MFQELPPCITKLRLISRGATGWVYQVDEEIALKYTRKDRLKQFQNENNNYSLFERHGFPPYLTQSFLRLPGINFLQLMPSGSLDKRIYSNQRRDYKNMKCLEVLRLEPTQKIEQWAMELSRAIAWLESLGLVHGDLRPANILLDPKDHLKLVDFDSIAEIGSKHLGNSPPWSRQLGPEAGRHQGTYGLYGATSEQFTFGSILYTLTRGFEPYEDKRKAAVALLRRMEFPELSGTQLDRVINRCWRGEYKSLVDLEKEMASLEGATAAPLATLLDDEYMAKMRQKCAELLDSELAGIGFEGSEEKLET